MNDTIEIKIPGTPGEKQSFKTRYSLEQLKKELARALDDDLHTRQWHNIVDWLIIGMILLSTAEIFISTFNVSPEARCILRFIDIFTLLFFTVEVSLRIWVAPEINPKWSGLKGRLRYCTSFYGLIDIISTYPFYLQWVVPMPVMALKTLRTARVVRTMRIGRYTKSFSLLTESIAAKRHELLVSMQFLVVITVILSLMLFFAEHDAQPDVYNNGFVSVLWAFAQYIGDPGGFADTPPVTGFGHVIACIVGLLGIAIVAVPTGILGAGFTEAIEERNHLKTVEENRVKLHNIFERKLDRPTGFQAVNPYRTRDDICARMGMTYIELHEAVKADDSLRLVNLASTIPSDEGYVPDRIAVELCPLNTSYGCCIDRGSRITIISTSNCIDPGITYFGFYLALIGGFNYISREIGERAPYKSFYLIDSENDDIPGFAEFRDDLRRLTNRADGWTISINVSSGAQEPPYPTNIHLDSGGGKGDARMGGQPDMTVTDADTYSNFYKELSETVDTEFGLKIDHQQYHNNSNPRLFTRKISSKAQNHIQMRIEWKQILWSQKRLLLAQEIARVANESILCQPLPPPPASLKQKAIGIDGYGIRI